MMVRQGTMLVTLAVLVVAWPARAQEAAPIPVYADPNRRAPRLSFTRGPAECLSEAKFRIEVAVALDGADHFDATAPDVLRVWFEKIPGGYRGTIEYTDANGEKETPKFKTSYNCEILGRSVGESASHLIPRRLLARAAPAPNPTPAPVPPDPLPSKSPEVFVPPPIAQLQLNLPPPPKPPPAPAPPPMDLAIVVSTTVLVTAGFTADAGPAVQLGAEVRGDWLSLGLELRGVLPGKVYARDRLNPAVNYTSERSVDISQLSGLLVPCVRFAKYFAGCGVVQAGGLISQSPVQTGLAGFVAFGPRFAVEVPFAERFAVFAFGEALFAPNLGGNAFAFSRGGPNGEPAPNVVWVQSVVSGFFGAGLSVRFQ